MRAAALVALIALAGCAKLPAEVIYQPVAVPCLGDMPARPAPSFGTSTGREYPGHTEASRAMARELARWEQWAEQVGVAVAGCVVVNTR